MNSTNYGYALYYPYLHIKNDSWLKISALYYNEISRIVPPSYIPNDNDIVHQLNEEFHFINNLDPRKAAKSIVYDFVEFANNELTDHGKRLKIRNEINPMLPMDSTFSLLDQKISDPLLNQLPEGLVYGSKDDDNFVEFEPVTGALYMTCLANKMAENRRIPVVSDDEIYDPFIKYFQIDKRKEGNPDVSYALGSMIIQTAIPTDIESLKVEKIKKFRRKTEDERIAFYDGINEITEEIPEIKDEEYLKKCLEHKQRKIEKEVKQLKRGLKEIGISSTTGILGLSIPTWASNLSKVIPDKAPIIASLGVCTLGVCNIINAELKYRQCRSNSPWSYVLSLKSRLDTKNYMKNVLTNWVQHF